MYREWKPFPWPARQIELYRYITGLVVAFGQSFINVCINTREHRELLGWLLGLPLGLGSLLLLRSGAQAISHAKCTSSNVDTAETACSLYYYIFSWPGCPTSQLTHTLLLTSQSCQPEHALLWRTLGHILPKCSETSNFIIKLVTKP